MEMSIDALFRWWHQRAECHIFCRWDWAAARGLVANTIEECKHTEVRKRSINASSLELINYPKKESEVWGHQRNLIRTRFITQSLYRSSLPVFLSLTFFRPALFYLLTCLHMMVTLTYILQGYRLETITNTLQPRIQLKLFNLTRQELTYSKWSI